MRHRKRILPLAAVLILAAALIFMNARDFRAEAASSGEIQEQIDKLKEEKAAGDEKLEQLRSQLSDTMDEMMDVVNRKNIIDQEISVLHGQLQTTNDMIASYTVLIADKQEELDREQQRLTELNSKYKERIRAMEEDGNLSYWSVIFEASSLSDLLDKLTMINEIAAADQRRLDEISAAAQAVAKTLAELKEQKAELEATRESLEQTQIQLEEKRAEADRLLADLIARGEEYEAYIEAGEAAQDERANEIAQLQDQYDLTKYLEWLATSEPPTTAPPPTTVPPTTVPPTTASGETPAPDPEPTAPPEPSEGEAVWRSPLTKPSWIVSPYGMRIHPKLGVWRMHEGVDLDGDLGDPIVAARSGVVTWTAYEENGGGNYIFINHGDGYSSTYMHMTHFIVKVGDIVSAGQVVGYMGSTGLSTGVHLHFGIYYNGNSVNPADYVDFS